MIIHDAELEVGHLRDELNQLKVDFATHRAESNAAREALAKDVKDLLAATSDMVSMWKAAGTGGRAIKWFGGVIAGLAAIGGVVIWIVQHLKAH